MRGAGRLSRSTRRRLPVFCALLLALVGAGAARAGEAPAAGTSAVDAEFTAAVTALKDGGFADRASAAEALAALERPRGRMVLEALLARELFFRRADGLVVVAVRADGGYSITDAASGKPLGVAGRRDVRRIATNNALRAKLRLVLARLSLTDPAPEVRRQAALSMAAEADADTVELLGELLTTEPDAGVRDAFQQVLSLDALRGGTLEERFAAIDALRGQVGPDVRAALLTVAEEAGETEALREAAADALADIERHLDRLRLLETVFFGLSLGSVLVLAAAGLAITFGVMGVINMAHGELIMLGAYAAYVMQLLLPEALGLALVLAVPMAFLVSGLAGVLIERGVIQHLYGRPLETLLATFGVSLILQQAVRSVFSPLNRSVTTPEWMSGALEITEGLSLTYTRLYILLFALLVFFALLLLLTRTRFGLEVRAVAQNRAMARAMGVRGRWVDAMTFGLGSGVAGIAGVALSQLTNVGPNLGQAYIVDSFLVVVFGGVGNLWGTLVAGMSLGVANKFLEPVTGAVLAKVLVLVAIILFIQKRPRGLFPQRGRAAEA